jgi:hypothetical protein
LLLGIGGNYVSVEQVKRGMDVMTLKGPKKVAAIVQTSIPSGKENLCHIEDGLDITPWNPIRAQEHDEDKWVLPCDVVKPQVRPCEGVYSILLASNRAEDADAHNVSIGGVWCVTLGHGLISSATGDIRAHAFLGNYKKVLKEISNLDGFYDADGVAKSSGTKRAGVDHKICGFIRDTEGL